MVKNRECRFLQAAVRMLLSIIPETGHSGMSVCFTPLLFTALLLSEGGGSTQKELGLVLTPAPPLPAV